MIVGVATSFSSTIVGLKLLPTTTLHHKRRGEIIIAVLLLQDFLAIGFLLVFSSITDGSHLLCKISVTVVIRRWLSLCFPSEKYIIDALIKSLMRFTSSFFFGYRLVFGMRFNFVYKPVV